MSRNVVGSGPSISVHNGVVHIADSRLDVTLRDKFCIVQINQRLLLPGLRRKQRKIIYMGNQRCGICEHRGGGIPIDEYRVPAEYLSDHWSNVVCETLGVGCPRRRRGYFLVKLRDIVLVITPRHTEDGGFYCPVYCRHNSDYIGYFIISQTFDSVAPRLGAQEFHKEFYIAVGYVMSCLLQHSLSHLTYDIAIK